MLSDISKKAIVIGGRTSIGFAIVIKLVSEGYFVEILDSEEPKGALIPIGSYAYHSCDLLCFVEAYISSLAAVVSVERNIA